MEGLNISPRVLFVDDDATRLTDFIKSSGVNPDYCNNFTDFVRLTDTNRYDYIFLDHDFDLIDSGLTGRLFARHIADNDNRFADTTIVVHSTNSIGAAKMADILKFNTLQVNIIPNSWSRVSVLDNRLVITV